MTDAELINLHGGPAQLAKKLGWSESRAVQRIHNWRTRGIPAVMKLKYPDLLLYPDMQAASSLSASPSTSTKEAGHG